jgi:predicted ATP-grasp superfamily ATP-dependent carboligase
LTDLVDRPAAVVIGLDSLQGLQTARLLARRGVPVIAFAKNPGHHACRTNVCTEVRTADTGGPGLIDALRDLGAALPRKAVLFPCEDKNVLLVSRHREELARWFHVVMPPSEVVELLMDKVAFYRFADEAGLPIPRTFIIETRAEADEAARSLRYPCVVKPPMRTREWMRHTKKKAFKVTGPAELLGTFDHYHPWSEQLIAQEWVEGDDATLYSCNSYYDSRSKMVATFTARKLRQWPPEIGQSCLGEECRDETVVRLSTELFELVEYHGLAYLEVKRDEGTGEYFIIEPNIARPTGRSAIAEAGGVELLYTMYADALGLPLPVSRVQTYGGVKWIHVLRDLQSALSYWRRGDLTLGGWVRSVRGRKVYALFSWSDPLPFLTALISGIPRLLSARERGGEDYDMQRTRATSWRDE